MAAPFTPTAISSYNANPPPDDGSQVPSNRVDWATIKTKIGDPIKTGADTNMTAIAAGFAKIIGGAGVTTTATNYTVGASDQGKLVKATAALTLTTPDATVVTSPFVFGVLNTSASDVTLDGSGSQTINGSASLTMKSGDGWLLFTDGTNWFAIGRKTGILPRGHIDGCILSNGTDATNDINIAAGVCRDSTNVVDITVAAMSGKQLDANWAPGAAAGMRNSAAGIANGTYHIYAVAKADGTQDIYAHTSATVATVITALQAESGGESYVYARRIGSIIRAGATILAFTQRGDDFNLVTAVSDVFNATPGTNANTGVLASVPNGIAVLADVSAVVNAGGSIGLISALTDADGAPSVTSVPQFNFGSGTAGIPSGQIRVWTNTAQSIRYRVSTNDTTGIMTRGWTDPRGKDA